MDDRIAKALLENNILVRQKVDEGRIALLEKLSTVKSVDLQTLPIPGVVQPPIANSLNWKNIFVKDDFVSAYKDFANPSGIGDLGWIVLERNEIDLESLLSISDSSHPGVIQVFNNNPGDNYLALLPLPSVNTVDLLQYVVYFDATALANEGCVVGLMDLSSFAVDGSAEGAYFKHENGDTNWQCVTTYLGSTTQYDSGVAFTAATWYLFEIKRTATDAFEFYINLSLVGTHQADKAPAQPVFGMSNQGTDFSIYMDYFAMQLAPILQRWD